MDGASDLELLGRLEEAAPPSLQVREAYLDEFDVRELMTDLRESADENNKVLSRVLRADVEQVSPVLLQPIARTDSRVTSPRAEAFLVDPEIDDRDVLLRNIEVLDQASLRVLGVGDHVICALQARHRQSVVEMVACVGRAQMWVGAQHVREDVVNCHDHSSLGPAHE